ncbi:MAG: hypothetical protein ACLTWR_13100 [Agathobaculum desmolans]|uniref:hypothetical protein n=1 Tax=Agathobaculum desmolans TaxID=39484 RepID=UPI0004E240C9|nr:hypothetical protein [Agathobaculum desmolans]
MKKAGYVLGYVVSLWMLFALWVRVMTFGDIGPVMRPYYEAVSWMYGLPALWLVLCALLAGIVIVRLFRGTGSKAEKNAAFVLALLYMASVFGWAVFAALVAAA